MKRDRMKTIEGRTFAPGVEHLGSVVVCSISLPIIRGRVEDIPELRDDVEGILCGSYDIERACILVRAGQPKHVERDTIVHEIGHAFVLLSGLGHMLRGAISRPKRYDEFEEALIRTLTPHVVALIDANAGAAWL